LPIPHHCAAVSEAARAVIIVGNVPMERKYRLSISIEAAGGAKEAAQRS
jgi:hypothetical protein